MMKVNDYSIYLKWCIVIFLNAIAVYWLAPIYLGVFSAFTLASLIQTIHPTRFSKWSLISLSLVVASCFAYVSFMLYQSAEKFIPNLHIWLDFLLQQTTSSFPSDTLQTMAKEVISFETIVLSFTHSTSIVMDLLLFIVIFLSAFIQFYRQPDWYVPLLPREKRNRYSNTMQRVQQMSSLFFRNEVLLFGFTWFATTLFAWLVHVPQPFFIGFLVALADLIPFIGISLFYIPFTVYGYMTEQWMIVVVTLVTYVFVVITRQLLEPLLWKPSVRIPTFLLLVCLTSLVMILGVKGLLLLPLLFIALSELNQKNA